MNDELELESQEKISFSVWKKIFKIVFRSKKRAITLALYMVLLSALDVLTPIVSSKALEVFFGEKPQFEYMGLFIGIYVAIAILYMIAIYSFVRKAGEIEAEVSLATEYTSVNTCYAGTNNTLTMTLTNVFSL